MNKLFALVTKELLVLSKDIHGLVVLFIMPAVFILIMSLAMQDSFDEHTTINIDYALIDNSNSPLSHQFVSQLDLIKTLRRVTIDADDFDIQTLTNNFTQDRYKFAVIIPGNFAKRLLKSANSGANEQSAIEIYIAPTVKSDLRRFFTATLRSELIRLKIATTLAQTSDEEDFAPSMDAVEKLSKVQITQSYLYQDGVEQKSPTSVQQNVPAWLVFAMFFVVVPLSNAFIVERQHGTMLRLRMMNIYATSLLLAKIVPYYFVNQIQMVLMLLVGIFIVPLLGGHALNGPSSFLGLFIISSATSIAAISFALLISTFAKSTAQATTLGGIFNIIFGALGGIMVPKFIMPAYMQSLTIISPMAWGLEGYLDVLLRNTTWMAVLPESISLLIFGMLCLVTAAFLFSRQRL